METTVRGHWRVDLAFLCALIVFLGPGCSRRHEHLADSEGHPAVTSQDEKGAALRVDQLFGKYVTRDYAWCFVLPPEEPEAWARERLGEEDAILPEVFVWRRVVIRNPTYKIRYYPALTEGDVAAPWRRRLSDYHGAGTERDVIAVLEVYEAGADYPTWGVEIIDENTLWEMWQDAWLFEWRREGTGSNPIPLKERALGEADR